MIIRVKYIYDKTSRLLMSDIKSDEQEKEPIDDPGISKDKDNITVNDSAISTLNSSSLNSNINKSAINIALNVPDIVIPKTPEDYAAFQSDIEFEFKTKKARLLLREKAMTKGMVIACDKCKYRLTVMQNYWTKGWICYNCGAKEIKPYNRQKDYFMQTAGFRKKKQLTYTADGKEIRKTIDMPIKRNARRGFRDKDLMNRQQILAALNARYENVYTISNKDIRNAAMMALLFETGSRIEEVVGVPAYETKEGKLHSIKNKFDIEPIKRKQVSVETMIIDGKSIEMFCVKKIPVLKRREQKAIDKDTYMLVRAPIQRDVIVPMSIEKDFVFFINRYLMRITDPEAYLFKMRASNAYKIVYRYFGKKYCHIFRHFRASDLASPIYDLNALQAQHFFSWASSRQFERYSHISQTDLIKAMTKTFIGR